MALFPIYGRFIGDCVPHLVAVDTGDTMAQVAEKIAVHSVGRRIPPRPDSTGFEVSQRLADTGFTGRVVLVSSRAASEYGELVGESGAIGFIAKDELSGAALARVLEQGAGHGAH